jgi:hypothetical protein
MRAGFASSSAASISGSFSFRAPDISVVGNGISCARSKPSRVCALEAKWRDAILQQADLGQASRLPIPFNDATNRAHAGKERIKARLIGDLDPDEWDFPPKPKWMRWSTYNQYSERYDHYDDILDRGCIALAAKFLGK